MKINEKTHDIIFKTVVSIYILLVTIQVIINMINIK